MPDYVSKDLHSGHCHTAIGTIVIAFAAGRNRYVETCVAITVTLQLMRQRSVSHIYLCPTFSYNFLQHVCVYSSHTCVLSLSNYLCETSS